MGFSPRNAAKSTDTGGSVATVAAEDAETPWAVNSRVDAEGSPMAVMVKNSVRTVPGQAKPPR